MIRSEEVGHLRRQGHGFFHGGGSIRAARDDQLSTGLTGPIQSSSARTSVGSTTSTRGQGDEIRGRRRPRRVPLGRAPTRLAQGGVAGVDAAARDDRAREGEGPHPASHMAGGLNNPLGARALYIGARMYRIHGSNEPWTIGHAVSSGCIRLTNDDVVDLYDRVPVGTRVVVLLSTQPQNEDAVASAGPRDKPILPNAVVKTRLPVKAPAPPVFAVKASAKVIDSGKSAEAGQAGSGCQGAAKAGCRDDGAGHRGQGDGRAGAGAENSRAGDRGESVRQRRRQSVSACRGGGAGHDRAQEAAHPARDGDAQGRAGRHHARGDRSAQRAPPGKTYPAKAAADG